MSKNIQMYSCTACGYDSRKWFGQCPSCREWNTAEETSPTVQTYAASAKNVLTVMPLGDIRAENEPRRSTGISELDRALGSGLVRGSVVLISGEPGIGKSTLLLQICGRMAHTGAYVLYVSGEESKNQISLRAQRLDVTAGENGGGIGLLDSTDCDGICATILKLRQSKDLACVIIDSIQTMRKDGINSVPGSITQVRECASALTAAAKQTGVPLFLVGHVNKEGGIAGPKVLEHMVDTVLSFEGDRQFLYRILRAQKNRFGRTNEIGVFEMKSDGLREVPNPSAFLLGDRKSNVSGVCVLPILEGSRPILTEVQALVTKTAFGTPRRTAAGFDYNRLCLLIAVLEKRTGFFFGGCDVYVNIAGGIRAEEPAADLAVCLALYSGLCDKPVPLGTAAFGEVGLTGEIRGVPHAAAREKEAARLGFEMCITPKNASDLTKAFGMIK